MQYKWIAKVILQMGSELAILNLSIKLKMFKNSKSHSQRQLPWCRFFSAVSAALLWVFALTQASDWRCQWSLASTMVSVGLCI